MTRVLVAYATKHHSTAEIAAAISESLRARGHEVDCIEAGHAHAAGYEAIVLGSAVYMGRWRREARHFLDKEKKVLRQVPFWVFSSGPVGPPDPEASEDADKWLEPRSVIADAEALGVREHVVFGGRMPEHPRGFIENAMSQGMPEEYRDLRDWDRIRGWADSVADQL